MKVIFYKMKIVVEETGLTIITNKFHSFHETECFHFCIQGFNKGFLAHPLMDESKTILQNLKRMNIRVYRIHKSGSRIAFKTEQEALDNLIMMKIRHINHMERDIEFYRAFLSVMKETKLNELDERYKSDMQSFRSVPETEDLVNEHFVFD